MSNSERPLFSSFDEAWRWFNGGGAIETVEQARQRFTQGRGQFLAFQVRIADRRIVAEIAEIQRVLAALPGIELQSSDLLHISVRGCGFQVLKRQHEDEVLRGEVPAIAERAASILKHARRIEATLGPVNVFPDAVVLELHDGGALGAVRSQLAGAIARDALIDDTHYLPHCTIAVFASSDAGGALRPALGPLRERAPARLKIDRIELARWWFTGFDERESVEAEPVRTYRLR